MSSQTLLNHRHLRDKINYYIDKLSQTNSQLQEIDQKLMNEIVVHDLEHYFSQDQLEHLEDDKLEKRIYLLMVIELNFGMLKDFTDEERQVFETAVKGEN